MKRRLGRFTDAGSGEVSDGMFLVPVRLRIKGPYALLMLDALGDLSEDRGVGVQEWRVLAKIVSRMDFENWVRLPQSEIAERLRMRQPHVSRALGVLAERGILVRGPKVAGGYTYRLNSQLIWRGRVPDMLKHRAAAREPKLRIVHDADQAPG